MIGLGISKPSPTFSAHSARNFRSPPTALHTGSHLRVRVSHPIIDEEFPAFAGLQDRFSESLERMETDAFPPHLRTIVAKPSRQRFAGLSILPVSVSTGKPDLRSPM